MSPRLQSRTALRIILDTNVCLDWLAFRDAGVDHLARALAEGQVELLTCPPMRRELQHMLEHASLARWQVDSAHGLALHDRHSTLLPEPTPGACERLKCSDPDDQVFIDLAVTQRAAALLTHDRALLKLARRARRLGIEVLRPRDWPGAELIQDPAETAPAEHPIGR